MAHKHYQGRTGVVFNVTRRALGVRINKVVNGRIIEKMVNVRIEHVRPSKCKDEFKRRVKDNEEQKRAVRDGSAEKISLKRQPRQPHNGFVVKLEEEPTTIQPVPFYEVV